jgi:endo-1,4-beta-mannosidase
VTGGRGDNEVDFAPSQFWTGLNYWPADTAMYWWSRFDLEAARADLARIAAAGFGYVRFFLLWEAFQPQPNSVSATALRDLELFANAADQTGLRLQPTLFTGHMSGANWLPDFATQPASVGPRRFQTVVSGEPRRLEAADLYGDEGLLRAQELLAREVARVLAQHRAMWSWDLANEHSNVARPRNRDQARRWLARIVEALRSGGSQHPLTIGLHMEDLEQDRQLGPKEAAEACDYLCMHGYPLYATWARHEFDAVILPFLGLVTQWLGGKPVLFQEFGLPTVRRGEWETGSGRYSLFDEADGAAYYREALAELRREMFLGAFGWCAFDYAEHLWQLPPLAANPHERFFGLFHSDRSAKPAIDAWRDFHTASPPSAELARRGTDWIDLDQDQFWRSPAEELQRLYTRFVEL